MGWGANDYASGDGASSAGVGGGTNFGAGGGGVGNSAPSTPPGASGVAGAAASVGKTDINLLDPTASVESSAANMQNLVAPPGGGGPIGFLGSLGIPGGPNLGGAVGTAATIGGGALGAVGQIGIPGGPNLGDVAKAGVGVLGAPEQWMSQGQANLRTLTDRPGDLPPDLQAQLDSGASAQSVADQLVARGQAWANTPVHNALLSMVTDPMNLIAPGIGKLAGAVGDAGTAVKAGSTVSDLFPGVPLGLPTDAASAGAAATKLGIPTQIVGTAYNAGSALMGSGGKFLYDHILGGTTSDLFHAWGVPNYNALKSGFSQVGDTFVAKLNNALGYELAFHNDSTVLEAMGSRINKGLMAPGNIADELKIGLSDIGKGRSIDSVNNIRSRAIDLGGITDRLAQATRDVAMIGGDMGPANAELVAQGLPLNDNMMQLLSEAKHGAWMVDKEAAVNAAKAEGVTSLRMSEGAAAVTEDGLAGTPLARDVAAAKPVNVDLNRLTGIADNTMTKDRAASLLATIEKGGEQQTVVDAINKYDVLRSKFGSSAEFPTNAAVRTYLENGMDTFPQEVHLPTTGKGALPSAIGDLRAKWAGNGYDLGFAPEDGIKTFRTVDGETYVNPFAYETTGAAPINARNLLGRGVDALTRDVNQRQIVQSAQQRMTATLRPTGIPQADSRRIMQGIIDAARTQRVPVRGMDPSVYNDIFKNVLGDERYAAFAGSGGNPTYAVMKAYEGNLREIGLTQKFTGALKTQVPPLAHVTDNLYPGFRFGRMNPMFQLQQFVEGPFFGWLRGTNPVEDISARPAALYQEFMGRSAASDPVFEEYANDLNTRGALANKLVGPNSLVGRALAHLPSVGGTKDQQMLLSTMNHFGPDIVKEMRAISPDIVHSWEVTWGTDPHDIGDGLVQMMKDRAAPKGSNLAEVMANARPDAPLSESITNQVFARQLDIQQRLAYNTINLSTDRNFLERTINHPFLAMYPFSYYYGKVIPEFARFLFKAPFGYNAPGLAASQLDTLHQQIVGQMAADPKGFAGAIKQNPNLLYILQLVLPATPWNVPVNAPAFVRHISQTAQTSTGNPDYGNIIATAPYDALQHMGPTGVIYNAAKALGDVGKDINAAGNGPLGVFGDIQSLLEQHAQSYDNIFNGAP